MIDQTIAHYRILEQLGQGGMGVVYKAEDTKLQRTVALKFLPESYRTLPESRAKLLAEARAASRLSHPNIVTIHSVEESDAGDFIVMEFVEGGTLRSLERPLPYDSAIELMRQTAEGLAAAHERGIVHRDIKPENLLIDSAARVRISDFGLARVHRGDHDPAVSRTIAGTPQYMSPEQATGEPVDQRSDIFSLGAVFYEVVAQRAPFQGDYDMAVLYAIVQSTPPPLSEFDVSIPAGFERMIERCLAKDPADRYPNCQLLVAELRELQREPASSQRASRMSLSPVVEARHVEPTRIIGRQHEVATIRSMLDATRDGHGHTIFICGEPGIGKTWLAEQAATLARTAEMAVLSGRCLPLGGGLPYHAYSAAIRHAVPRLDDRAIAPLLNRASGLGIDFKARLPVLRAFLHASGENAGLLNPEQLWDALLNFLTVMSSERPLALMIDDLHWADADTVRLLSYFARSIRHLPILQIATTRPPDTAGSSSVQPAGFDDAIRQLRIEENAVVIDVGRLTDAETAELATSLAPDVDRESSLFREIIHKAAGNPLFVSELSRYLSGARAEPSSRGDSIPGRVRDVIVQRLAGLSAVDRELLEVAACEPDFFLWETVF